jgi:Rod binding domain-containing protein
MDGIEPIGMPPVISPLEHLSSMASREVLRARYEIPDANDETSPAGRTDEQKKQLAKDFESVLLTQLFNQVQESIGNVGFDEEDGTSTQVQGLFWSFLARDVADKGGFGLWQDIYQHFKQMEGALDPGAAIDEEL